MAYWQVRVLPAHEFQTGIQNKEDEMVNYSAEVKADYTRRSIDHIYLLDDVSFTDGYDGDFHAALIVSTSHDKDRKRFVRSITRQQISKRSRHWTPDYDRSCPLPGYVYLPLTVARFSKNALEDADRLSTDSVADHLDALLEWAAKADH